MPETAKPQIKVSVRALVEYFYRSGDLDLVTYTSSKSRQQGIRAHQKLQKSRGENYQKEISVSRNFDCGDFDLLIRGRIDGLYIINDKIILEEIKSTTRDLNKISKAQYDLWWGQVMVYAAIYLPENSQKEIDLQLAVYELARQKETILKKHYTLFELQNYLNELKTCYLKWASLLVQRQTSRDLSLQAMSFPFPEYRQGQRQLAVQAYYTVRDEKKLLVQAPTGIGKTMGVLFPEFKALGMGLIERIFYLTARTTGKDIAASAVQKLIAQEVDCRVLVLTSKERICFNPPKSCHPDECVYARGFYDKLGDALEDIFSQKLITREVLEAYSRRHKICPFEFSLETALFCDCIICDYNYAFDPRVYLRRFFEASGERYSFLVDEAHNLVDRSREMFSSELFKSEVLSLRRLLKDKNKELYKHLSQINKVLLAYRKNMADDKEDRIEKPLELEKGLRSFTMAADRWLAQNNFSSYAHELKDFYFTANAFLWGCENYSEQYRTLYEKDKSDLRLKLFCIDPSQRLAECTKRCKSIIYFSATLKPFAFFAELFGSADEYTFLDLGSPFPPQNLKIKRIPLSTRYKHRDYTLKKLCITIRDFILQKQDNILVFFPSYKYMARAVEEIREMGLEREIIIQKTGMTEMDRNSFLEKFNEKETPLTGFVVMGGVFGEGIDLAGAKLKGAVIVGVGLPGIDQQRELIRSYYSQGEKGYDYAYTWPGMTRVLQAAGRVIRSEYDTGRILLIDDRFFREKYRSIMPPWWRL